MAYTSYSSSDAAALVKANKDAAAALKANKNPFKSNELKKKVEETGIAAKKKLDADIAGVRKNAFEHFARVDDFLGHAVGALKASKDSYSKWEATQADKDRDMATYAEGYIQSLHKLCKEDADAYGKSWFSYRGYTAGIDAKYCGDFNTAVGKLMADQKGVGVKIDKMLALSREGAALRALVQTKHAGEANDIDDYRKAAARLQTEIDGMIKTMTMDAASFHSARNNAATLGKYAQNPNVAKLIPLKNIEGIQTNLINLVKNYLSTMGSLKKVYATRIQAFPPEAAKDGAVKASVTTAQSLITEADKEVKAIEKLLQQALKDVALIRGKYKK